MGCLTSDTMVLSNNGWKKIEEIGNDDKIFCINKESLQTEISKCKLLKREHKGQLYHLVLKNGLELKMTPEHPLMVIDKSGKLNWKIAKDLVKNDYIGVLDEITKNIGKKTEINGNKSRLLGLIIGDGTVYNHGFRSSKYINIVNTNNDILNDFKNILKNEFKNENFKVFLKPRTKIGTKDCFEIRAKGKIYDFVYNYLGENKFIVPEVIFKSDKKIKSNFLKGLYSTDGTICKRGRGYGVIFYSISKKLCSDVKLLLLEFGINARIYKMNMVGSPLNKNRKYSLFSVIINKQRDIKKFKQIGFIDKNRQEKFFRISKILKLNRDNFSIPYICKEVILNFNNNVREKTINIRPKKTQKISKYNLKRLAKYSKGDYIKNLANSDLNFIKIKSIKKEKHRKCFVFDLIVPKEHNFIANGIVSHNSYSELTMQEDINNIVAMECLHVCWIHPPHFVGRNALVGLETYGRNFEYGITRCIMYDLHENKKVGIPMGLVYIPIFRDREFEKQYIGKKLEQIEGVMTGQDISGRVDARFKIARALAKNSLFQNATNNTIRLALARKYCPFGLPDSAVKEIMVLARMPPEELDAMLNMETDADVIDVSLEDLGWGEGNGSEAKEE